MGAGMKQGLSKDEIIAIASRRTFSVERLSWRDESLRKKTRRLAKDGKLVLVDEDKRNFYYRASEAEQSR